MMRPLQLSIAGLMAVALLSATCLAALMSGSKIWSGAMFLTAAGFLTLGIVGAICRPGPERAWWLGFSLFGWGYLVLAFWDIKALPNAFTDLLYEALSRYFPPLKSVGGGPSGMGGGGFSGMGGGLGGIGPARGFSNSNQRVFIEVCHSLTSLLAGAIGGVLSRFLFGNVAGTPISSDPTETGEGSQPLEASWRWPIAAMCVSLLLVAVALAGLRWNTNLFTGTMLSTTWGILGLLALGGIFRRGRIQAAMIGGALFGIGYLLLTLQADPERPTWPRVAAEEILNSARPWLAPPVQQLAGMTSAIRRANTRIVEALDREIPLHFRRETPLEDVLKSIEVASKDDDGRGVAIYVDPIGLQEAEKTLQSPMVIDLEGVPLRTALKLALKQLSLGYSVLGGVLFISDQATIEESHPSLSLYGDPYLTVGHCFLALIAAVVGSLLAPLVAGRHA